MIVVNDILADSHFIPIFEYLPEKYILKNVLQKKLKCSKIEFDKSKEVLQVYWVKE